MDQAHSKAASISASKGSANEYGLLLGRKDSNLQSPDPESVTRGSAIGAGKSRKKRTGWSGRLPGTERSVRPQGRPLLRPNELADGTVFSEASPETSVIARQRARQAVWRAVRRGEKRKPKVCWSCHKERPIEVHHWKGYAQKHWLDVLWICRECHVIAHHGLNDAQLTAIANLPFPYAGPLSGGTR